MKSYTLVGGETIADVTPSNAQYIPGIAVKLQKLKRRSWVVMQVFENCSVVLAVKDLPFKEKKRLKLAITDNGGRIAYVVNKQCSHVITNNMADVSSNRQRSIQKYQVPVVPVEYVSHCLEKGALLSVKEYGLVPFPRPDPPSQTGASRPPDQQATVFKVTDQTPVRERSRDQPKPQAPVPQRREMEVEKDGDKDGETRATDYPSKYDVAKYSIFENVGPNKTWSVLELHSAKGDTGRQYRLIRSSSKGGEDIIPDGPFVCASSEKALEMYETLERELLDSGFTKNTTLSPQHKHLGSYELHRLLVEERMNSSDVAQEVSVFVELLWTEALGCLGNILKIPLNSISLNDVSRAEGLLLQMHRALGGGSEEKQLSELMAEFYTLLPHKEEWPPTMRAFSLKLDLCQLIRDMLKVSEATLWNPAASCLGKYRALRCSIETVPQENPDFLSISKLLADRPLQIQQVFRVSRMVELQAFRDDLGNVRTLLHSSAPSNFVGILSRGLLMPRVGVEHHGIDRTDLGNLGGGIYFSNSVSTSLKYSKPSTTDGSRLLLVCLVALGRCKDLRERDPTLSSAPEGHHSVHGVRRSPTAPSDFEDDEYVVYQTDQVQIQYVVQFTLPDEPLKTFQPTVDLSPVAAQEASSSDLLAEDEEDSIGMYKNRRDEVSAGLMDNMGQTLPLQAVHVKCKLVDLLTQVVIFQTYTNLSEVPIEAKYVFPLDESAAVCGFEAFINGKRVVGQVKEKEQARREYRQAVTLGHGAYLMDQDAPDVFTISVGNLPPGATVLIKVTYITELVVREGSLLFSLPGSVAPWLQSKALNQRTQVSVEKVCVNELQADRVFALDMSIEMPYKILNLSSVTHLIKVKRTDCRAVVSLLSGQTLGPEGFHLSFTLSQVHLPRMWVENHPDQDSQACMLVFYPHFDPSTAASPGGGAGDLEVVILLDTSESMRGVAMQDARRIAVQLLKTLDPEVRVNILSFGSDHKELFLSSRSCRDALLPATKFAMSSPPVGGSTELWRPLRSLSLLPPSRGIRNLLLISDGHVQNEALTLRLVRESVQHTRVFTCAVSPTANRHMLRALAQAGGGAYQCFDAKTKHTWMGKVSSQARRMASPGCSSVSVKWQQFNPAAATPLQAPAQLNTLFSDCHTLVLGFVPHCTQATLYGRLSEQEIETVVSTSELQKTKGTLLHKLTARAVIRDYEDGSLHADEAEHEGKKEELKSFIIELSKEYSIVTQYTSFVAIEERDSEKPDVGFTDIPKLITEEDVDFLPYLGWEREKDLGALRYYCSSSSLSPPVLAEEDVAHRARERKVDGSTPEWDTDFESLSESEGFFCDGIDLSPEMMSLELSAPPPPGLSPEMMSLKMMGLALGAPPPPGLSPKRRGLKLSAPPPPGLSPEMMSLELSAPPPPGLSSEMMSLKMMGIALGAPPPPGLSPKRRGLKLSAPPPPGLSPEMMGLELSAPPPPALSSRRKGLKLSAPPPPGLSPLVKGNLMMAHQPSRHVVIGSAPAPGIFGSLGSPRPPPPPPAPGIFGSLGSPHPPPPPPPPAPGIFGSLGSPCPPPPPPAPGIFGSLGSPRPPPPAPPAPGSGPLGSPYLTSGFIPVSCQIRKMKMVETLAIQTASPPSPPMALPPPPPPPPGGHAQAYLQSSSTQCPPPPPPPRLGANVANVAQKRKQQSADREGSPLGSSSFRYASYAPALRQSSSVKSLSSGDTLGKATTGTLYGAQSNALQGSFEAGGVSVFSWDAPESECSWSDEPAYRYESMKSLGRKSGMASALKGAGEKEGHRSRRSKAGRRKEGVPRVSWAELFDLQHQDGYWECSEKLGYILHLDLDFFARVFLKEKGIASLGVRAGADILRLVATLLVLQLLRLLGESEGDLLQTLFRLKEGEGPTSLRGEAVKRAVRWVSRADRQYPCLCSRLELGLGWEAVTRQLLGAEALHVRSSLRPVLERTSPILAQ